MRSAFYGFYAPRGKEVWSAFIFDPILTGCNPLSVPPFKSSLVRSSSTSTGANVPVVVLFAPWAYNAASANLARRSASSVALWASIIYCLSSPISCNYYLSYVYSS